MQEFTGGTERFLIVEPATGETSERVAIGDVEMEIARLWDQYGTSTDGSTLLTRTSEGQATLWVEEATGTRRTILEAEGPKDYSFNSASWSPDEEWILLQDSEGRLIIVAAEGDPNPRVVAESSNGWMTASWFMPGRTEGTRDPSR